MISLEEIKAKTLWTGRLDTGAVITGTADVMVNYNVETELVSAAGQPIEVRPFWLAYEYAIRTLERKDLVELEDFYEEWTNNPDAFDPDLRPTQMTLRTYFLLYDHYPTSANFKIYNYDGYFVGSHHRKNFEDALDAMGDNTDFNVIEFVDEGMNPRNKAIEIKITIQSKKIDKVQEFAALANRFQADEVFG